MTIDVHAHVFPQSIAARALATLTAQANYTVQPVGDGTHHALIDQMMAAQIDRAVVCPIATKPALFDGILAQASALQVGAFGPQATTMLIPFASVHPADPLWQRHLQAVAAAHIRGVKLHPYYQPCTIDSPTMLDYFRCCRDLDLVVQCHCGFDIGFPREDLCGPARVANVVKAVPRIKLIAAHLGGWHTWEAVATHLLGHDVYLDTAILPQDLHAPSAHRILCEHRADRLLFGTDWPWLDHPTAKNFIHSAVADAPKRAAIFGLNAAALLGL